MRPWPPMAEGFYFVRPTAASATSLLSGEDDIWREADRITWGPAAYRTSFRALWTADRLYLRFDASDREPWNTMEKRDDPIWDEEVVEIFLDLDGSGTHYAEVELSPANVVCDVRMIQGSPDKKMDLAWELTGLSTRVLPRADAPSGWAGLLFLPWNGFASLPSARNVSLPPEKGDTWRFNVYRIERPGGKDAPNEGAVFSAYSPTGSPSFHVPASFQGFVFA